MLQPGQQPGANTPINTAITNENISSSVEPGVGGAAMVDSLQMNNKPKGGPLMGLINKGKDAQTYLNRLGGYVFGDNIAPWDPYYKDPYYDLKFDENDRLISDTVYGGLTKDQLNLDYPTYGWTTDARLGRDASFFSDEIQDFRQGN